MLLNKVSQQLGSSAAGAILGYVIGTLPSADLVAKAVAKKKSEAVVDLRASGSGNPGATNAAMVLGKKWGAMVLVADIAKGAGASAIGRQLAGPIGASAASTAAVVGHCYPRLVRGADSTGGKGVATSVGQVLGTFPAYFPIDFLVAGGTVAVPSLKQRAFVANSVASAVWIASSAIWWRKGWSTGWDDSAHWSLPVGATVSSAVIASKFLAAQDEAEK